MMDAPGEADAALPEAPRLDRALWTPSTPPLRERLTGIAGSVLAHLALAGALAGALLVPRPEPAGSIEIPVEIVIEGAASAQSEATEQAPAEEPQTSGPAVQEDASAQAAEEVAAAHEQDVPPDNAQEHETALPERDMDAATASEPPPPQPTEQAAPAIAEPVHVVPVPSLRAVPRAPAPTKPRPPENAKPKGPEQGNARVDPGQKGKPLEEARAAPRPATRISRSDPPRDRSTRTRGVAKEAAQPSKGLTLRVARAQDGSPGGEQGRWTAAASMAAASSYRSQVIAHLTRFKRYPLGAESRGAEGTPVVSFSLDNGGGVSSVALARSSGHSDIDAETLAMVRRAVPFPVPPPGAPHAITAAVSFQLR